MDIPYTVTARPDTGLWNAKVGIWLFLASEVMLFGGLFSSYIFLRLGADYPWPMDEMKVELGFINTLVLIASSVFVVYAWVALKMRNWRRFQFWMALVIASAGAFLVIKSIEYTGKFNHYHATLKDGTVISGHLDHDVPKGEAKGLVFEASHAIVDGASGSHYFLKYLENKSDIRFITDNGTEVNPSRKWFEKVKKGIKLRAKVDRLAAEGDTLGSESLMTTVSEDYKILDSLNDAGQLKLTLSKPGKFVIPRNKALSWEADKFEFTRGLATTLEGKLVDATLKLEIDELDMRVYLRRDDPREKVVADSTLFTHFNDAAEGQELLADFTKYHTPKVEAYEADVAEWKAEHSDKEFEEEPFMDFERVFLDKLHAEDHAEHGEEEVHAAAGAAADSHGGHPKVTIPFEDVKFFSNFGPRKNPFYAIYFTMTGLHGLHVLGGMLVLSYFLFFGRKLFLQNPEHMANRVEVGGLFWHFVDLVWIFLFPIFYLM